MLDNMQRIMLISDNNMNSKELDTQHVDTMDECDIFASPRKNKTVTVPRIQSMQDYILKHHKQLILGEINQQIAGGTLKEIAEECDSAVTLRAGDCHFGEMSFWRRDTYTLLVDVVISASTSLAAWRIIASAR